jgi:hypothetical protein
MRGAARDLNRGLRVPQCPLTLHEGEQAVLSGRASGMLPAKEAIPNLPISGIKAYAQGIAADRPSGNERIKKIVATDGTVRNLVCGAIVTPMEGAHGNQERHPRRFAGGA